MNCRLKLLLINPHNNRGMALPFALSIGVVMMLAGTIMIVRSQTNQSHVQAQQSTAESINAAEIGATRIFSVLNQNRYLAMYPDCQSRDTTGQCSDTGTTPSWANAVQVPKLTVCDQGEAADVKDIALNNKTWQPIDPNNAKQGEYRIISYEYSNPGVAPGKGILTVEGQIRGHNDLTGSVSQLTVEIPVSPGPVEGNPIPGVWLNNDPTDGTGNNGIEGNVLMGNCNLSKDQLSQLNVTGTDPETGQPYQAKHTNIQFPELPEIPATATYLGVVGENKDGTLAGVSGDITLPRVGDTPVSKTINNKTVEVYEYEVEDINFDSGSHSLTIKPGKKVTLYLQGNMIVKSNSGITHSCTNVDGTPIVGCSPTDFKIYGYGDQTHTICTAGNKRIEAFIFAPKYAVGTAGTGGGQGGIKGTVWANEWSNGKSCGSQTSNTAVVQTAKWEDLGLEPINTPPLLSNSSTWKRNQR
ncbi:MAG: hypothetical protein QNJ42_20815 [Crocosphaera sp.]|nr:hypothetical protein [Crocosphaera sp.]